jgi:hypothetical protein
LVMEEINYLYLYFVTKLQNKKWRICRTAFWKDVHSCFCGSRGVLGIVSLKRWSGAESPEGLGGE